MPQRRCGAPAICALIHALRLGGTRAQIALVTGQAERTVGEWIRMFRAEKLVRVADVLQDGTEVYNWIEANGPQRDSHKIRMTLEERSAAWRKRKARGHQNA